MEELRALQARKRFLSIVLAASIAVPNAIAQSDASSRSRGEIKHVLLISIDGMHAVDYLNCVMGISGVNNGAPYCETLRALGATGINYRNASTSKPSDSFPGLTAIVSGGSPRSFGVYYDVAYDRVLAPPTVTTGNGLLGGTCTAGMPNGTTTEYEEGIDINQNYLNGIGPNSNPALQANGGIQSIDAQRLIRDPYSNCAPVYPWNFPRTNTIFGVIHQNGGYTAWSDKHPSYSSVSGPGDGTNVDDYYSPEINSDVTNSYNQAAVAGITTALGESCATLDAAGAWTDSFHDIRCYDQLKVNAILNEIAGKDHLGKTKTKKPIILGMNFQAVSVGEKLIQSGVKGGYTDGQGTPSEPLLTEIQFVDAALGQMVAALKANNIFDKTLVVITAKHGQSPIDPNLFFPIPGHSGTNGESPVTLLANYTGENFIPCSESPNPCPTPTSPTQIGPTEDDVSLIWLNSPSQTQDAVNLLEDTSKTPGTPTYIGLGQIFYDRSLISMLDTPGYPAFTGKLPVGDPRTPDIIVQPNVGVIYTTSTKKQEEHGGFAHDDTNVVLLLSFPTFTASTVTSEVQTAQVAPTILSALGLDPNTLDAVRAEGTPVLPAVQFGGKK